MSSDRSRVVAAVATVAKNIMVDIETDTDCEMPHDSEASHPSIRSPIEASVPEKAHMSGS